MSTSQQCKRRRKQAVKDPKYKGQKTADASISRARLDAKIRREQDRQMRATKKRRG